MNDAVIERLNGALEGRYRIDRELGEGGMATAFLADDLRHDLMIQALQASGTESEARLVVVEGFDQVIRETGQGARRPTAWAPPWRALWEYI